MHAFNFWFPNHMVAADSSCSLLALSQVCLSIVAE